jgi:signal transduction histidine kinase
MGSGVAMLISLTIGWLTLALGLLAFRAGSRWYRAWRYGPPLDHSTLLVEYGRRMAAAADRGAIRELMVTELPRRLQAAQASLLLPESHYLVAVPADRTRPSEELRLPVSYAAVRWVASAGEAQLTSHGRLRQLIEQGRADLDWTRVMVPLMRGADLRGLWLLGARRGRLRFSPDDLRWLTALGRQATIVLEALDHAEEERRAASEMRALYRQVVSAREAERGHLSRELHDGLLQDLCAITRDLKALAAQPDAGPSDLPDMVARSGTTVNALRAICNDLRPPLLQHDLAAALSGLVEALDARSSTPIGCDISADALSLPDDVSLAIFRIAQEALQNAIRHADASEIAVRLTQYPDRLRLTVTDDGRGIAEGVDPTRFVADGHFGLAGMRERAAMIGARLDVQTAVDYGTVVVLDLPR